MGVKGLWKLLAPSAECRSLQELAVSESFNRNDSDARSLQVGVDASLWMCQIQYAFQHNHVAKGHSPEVRTLFYRLACLRRTPITAIFVFDGKNRPSIKRGRQVRGPPHWLTAAFQELIEAFGFTWYTAPAEAEAELAYLNQLGRIKAVFSSDGDTFVFGANRVVRPGASEDADNIIVYTAEGIRQCSDIQLTQGGILLIAILSGGDYDETGLPGCGAIIAHRLAQYGLGDSLLDAARTHSSSEFDAFLANWRQELRDTLCTDPAGYLGQRWSSVSASIPDDFPKPEIVALYAQPQTTGSDGGPGPPTLRPTKLDIAKLASICEHRFRWSTVSKIMTHLWDGLCVQMLCEAAIPEQSTLYPAGVFTSESVLAIRSHKTLPSPARDLRMYRVSISTEPLWAAAKKGLRNFHMALHVPQDSNESMSLRDSPPLLEAAPDSVRVWVPAPILELVLPDMTREFSKTVEAKANKSRMVERRKVKISSSKGKQRQAAEMKMMKTTVRKASSTLAGPSVSHPDVIDLCESSDAERLTTPPISSARTKAKSSAMSDDVINMCSSDEELLSSRSPKASTGNILDDDVSVNGGIKSSAMSDDVIDMCSSDEELPSLAH